MALKISAYFKLNFIPTAHWLAQAQPMLIGHPEQKEIFFFYQPLLDQKLGGKSVFYRLQVAEEDMWGFEPILLRFFLGYREINILVISQNVEDDLPLTKTSLNQRFENLWTYAQGLCKDHPDGISHLRRYSCWTDSNFPADRLGEFVEIFLADHTLKLIEQALLSSEKGFWFRITEPYHYALYERYILMYGLLLAYQISLEIFINELALYTIENKGGIEQLRKECAEFNAIFYFTNPIKPGNSNLRPSWNKLMQPFNMETLTAELMDQLEAVTQIHQIEQERERRIKDKLEEQERQRRDDADKAREARRQRRQNVFNFWLSIIGILLTALTIIEITPTELFTFFKEWKEFFASLN